MGECRLDSRTRGKYSAHLMASRSLRGGSRVGWVGGAVLVCTGVLAGCEDKGGSTIGDGGADAAIGALSGESRDLVDGGPNNGTQDIGVTLEDTSEHADTLTVGLGELTEPDASTPDVTSTDVTDPAPVTTEAPTSSDPVVTSGAPTSETPVETSSAPIDSTTATPVPSSEPVETSETPSSSAEVPTSDAPTTSAETPTSSDVPTTSAEVSSTGEIVVITSETPDAGSSSSETSSSSEPPLDIGGEVVGSADWVDLPAVFQVVGLAEGLDVAFEWELTGVPDGSAVTSADLTVQSDSQVTFSPDVAGVYTAAVTMSVGDEQMIRWGSVTVAKVDVGFLEIRNGFDGGYSYIPWMVPSDQSNEAKEVGCSFDTTLFDDFSWWVDVLWRETATIGFSYPKVPSDPTLFAYEYRNNANSSGVIQVATANSNCEDNRPTDLDWGRFPDFSPSAGLLSRFGDAEGSNLVASPPTVNDTVMVSNANAGSSDWWDNSSLIWTGYDCGEGCYPMVGLGKPGERGYVPVIDCSNVSESVWESLERVVALKDALLVEADARLWYVPLQFGDTGLPYASCEYAESDAYVIANNLFDFALAPDGKTLALMGSFNAEYPYSYLAIGPAEVPIDFEEPWQYTQLSMGTDYTGLHWIADSKQLVWTEIEVRYQQSDNLYWTELGGSRIYKINSDFSNLRTLAENAVSEYDGANSVITTGLIDIQFYYQGGF